jgi:hypothetical protein
MSNYAVAPDVDRCFTLLLDPRLPRALNAGEPRAVGHHAPRFILAASSRAAIVSIGQEQRTLFVSARRLVRESRAATHWRLLRERRVVRAVAPVACTFVGVMSNYAVAPDVDRCFTVLLDPRLPRALNAGEPRAVGHHAPRFILAALSRVAVVSIGRAQRTLVVSARRSVRESRAATHWRLHRERRVVRAVAPANARSSA